MESQETIEARLKSFLGQLQAEYGIFDRIVYKNKNQHRRSSYFQYLLKVRSDMRLLQSARIDDIVNSSCIVINGDRAKQKVQLLESLKRKKGDSKKHNFLEKLKGAARLLSQMVEPMLKAATQISILLARSFFVAFSVTVLALLARLRVLVQQILLDVVSIFNTVSTLSQSAQSVKLSQEGIEVFREYYPNHDTQTVKLKCVWETDKFVLHEIMNEPSKVSLNISTSEVALGESVVQYQSIETVLGDILGKDDDIGKSWEEDPACMNEDNPTTSNSNNALLEATGSDHSKQVVEEDDTFEIINGPEVEPPSQVDQMLTSSSPAMVSLPLKRKSGAGKVAFVSVKRAEVSKIVEKTEFCVKKNNEEDTFYSLLTCSSSGKP